MANKKLTGFDKVAVIQMGYQKKDYHFALYDEAKIGDKVLVSGNAANEIYEIKNIITAEEASEAYNKDITAEVICVIDVSKYEKRKEARVEKEKIKKKMDAIIKQMDEVKKYEMYAAENPELKELLQQFNELKG